MRLLPENKIKLDVMRFPWRVLEWNSGAAVFIDEIGRAERERERERAMTHRGSDGVNV